MKLRLEMAGGRAAGGYVVSFPCMTVHLCAPFCDFALCLFSSSLLAPPWFLTDDLSAGLLFACLPPELSSLPPQT